MTWAPFVVDSSGDIRDLQLGLPPQRFAQRWQTLELLEQDFVAQRRGPAAADHAAVLEKTVRMMTSQQLNAFRVSEESAAVQDRYGRHDFGRGCLMARRLIEAGVACVEVDLGGWDNHSNIFPTLQNDRLPALDQGMGADRGSPSSAGGWTTR